MMKAAVQNKGSPGKRVLWLAFLLLILLASSPVFAADYYVSTSGSDSNPGTQAAPWKTIAHAADAMNAGDTTYVKNGVYIEGNIRFRKSGTSSGPIKLLAAPGESPVINCPTRSQMVMFQSAAGALTPIGWITIEGFEIRGCTAGLRGYNIHDVTIRRNWVHDNRQGILTNGKNILIDRNILSHNGSFAECAAGGLDWKGTSSVCNKDHGMYVSGTNWTVTNNLFYDNLSSGLQVAGYDQSHGATDASYAGASNWLIANNTFAYQNYLPGLMLWQSLTVNNKVINNIFYENAQKNPSAGPQGISFYNSGGGHVLQNNLFYASGAGAAAPIGGTSGWQSKYTETGSVNANPNFAGAGATLSGTPNFQLQAGSPAIDSGQNLSQVTWDFAGGTRPFGSAHDRGAYEFGATPDSGSPPPNPTGGDPTTPPAGTNPCPPTEGTTTPPPSSPSTPAPSGTGRTYYLSPNGNNGGAGDSASPWKTFAFAIPKLNPGDTLMLKDGTYTKGTTGMPSVNCSAGAKNGMASAAITIQAENERKAWLKGDGGEALGIRNCSYWSVVGLRAASADVAGPVTSLIFAGKSNHIDFRRNLFSNSNRRVNQAMITYNETDYGLIEENEIYDYMRHGFLLAHSGNVTVRRNYANSRDYQSLGNIPGVYDALPGGDSLVAIYPGANNLVENNISERNMSSFSVQASGSGGYVSTNNRFYGNISLKDGVGGGLRIRTRQNNLTGMVQNTYIENNVTVSSNGPGAEFLANKNTIVTNASVLDGNKEGFFGNARERLVGDGVQTLSIKNSLAFNNKSAGFSNLSYSTFNVTNSDSFGNSPNYSPGSLATGNMSVNPGLGACKVFIPEGSPMKGKGANGDDIGANVLCRYQDGKLTDQQLWNWSTGQFPCGAIVPGVNDKAGQSCFDVNKRLNVNANGCTLPATPSCKQPAPPTDLPPPGTGTNPCALACPPGQEPEIDVIINDTVCSPAGAAVPVSIDIVDALTGQPAPLCRDVYVGPIPYGFTLSAGTIYESRTGGIVYKLTPAELLNLTITPPPGYSGALVLHVSYTPPPL